MALCPPKEKKHFGGENIHKPKKKKLKKKEKKRKKSFFLVERISFEVSNRRRHWSLWWLRGGTAANVAINHSPADHTEKSREILG